MITLLNAQGVDGGIPKHHDALFLIICQKIFPGNRGADHHSAAGQSEPADADTACEGHADKNKREDQGNTHVAGDQNIGAEQQTQVEHHVHDRGNVGQVVLVGCHDRGHDQNICNFTDLGSLDVEGQEREVQPASVTVDGLAKGQQHKEQNTVEYHHGRPVFKEIIQINGGDHGVQHNTQHGSNQLHDHISDGAVGVGSAGNGKTSKKQRNENNKNNTIQNNVTEIIKGITDEIDEKEPPRDESTIKQDNTKIENNNMTNTQKNTNTSTINNNSNVVNSTNNVNNTFNTNTTNTISNTINNTRRNDANSSNLENNTTSDNTE